MLDQFPFRRLEIAFDLLASRVESQLKNRSFDHAKERLHITTVDVTLDGTEDSGHMSCFRTSLGFTSEKIDGRIRVWRRRGERHLEPNVQPTTAYNGGSVMVWAGINTNGKADLVVVPGTLNGRRVIDEILRPHVIHYLQQMGPNSIFQDDNARPTVHGSWMTF